LKYSIEVALLPLIGDLMKKIEFVPIEKNINSVIDPPSPAYKNIPNWYRESSSFITDEKIPINYDGGTNHTIKKCMPLLDSMTSGYMFTLPSDIYVLDEEKHNGMRISWGSFEKTVVFGDHSNDQLQKYPKTNGYDEIFKWGFWWVIRTPPGYSCLITHPRHRRDLPFVTLDAIVDTDSLTSPILFPFLLDKNFSGKINKGTPIAQIFPFKRDSWKSEYKDFDESLMLKDIKSKSIIGDMYKKMFWKKKVYK
jgi:hypothetical protein